MEYFNISRDNNDINIELKDFTDDENHTYANKQEVTRYEILRGKNVFDEGQNENVYTDVENDEYENTKYFRRDSITRLNTLTRENAENEYTSFEDNLKRDPTYDKLDAHGKERESEIYNTIVSEDETLRPESVIGIYRNLKYVRSKRVSCLRRRWKLLLLLAIVLLVSIAGVITAVILVTSEEDPVQFTENFDTPMDTIEGTGSGESSDDGDDAKLTPFD